MTQQNYYGAPGYPNQQQGSANYPAQRPASTGAIPQYTSDNPPISRSFQSDPTRAYAPSETSYNLSDYSYGSDYAAGSGATGTARNNTFTDLQNLAYTSILHGAVQRDNTQPVAARQALSASQPQHVPYPSCTYPSDAQQQQPRVKSVNPLAGRSTPRSPVVASRQSNYSRPPLQQTGYQASSAQPFNAQQPTPINSPRITNANRAPPTAQPRQLQVSDHPARTLPNLTQLSQAMPTSASYHWSGQHQPQVDSSGSPNFETVDPAQVYDPWPEIQRKREDARAAKAMEERARAERERIERQKAEKAAEEARNIEEVRQAEGRRKHEEAEKAERERAEQERRKEEQHKKKANTKSKMAKSPAAAPSSSAQPRTPEVEAQARALMVSTRELNNQDPALIAKIWEEEQRTHGQSNAARPPAQSPKTAKTQATPSVQQTQMALAQRRSTATSPQMHPSAQAPASQQASTQTQQPACQQQPQPVTQAQQPAKKRPPIGTTAWPNDKKDRISKAASDWLNAIPENHDKQISPQEICDLLNMNPKYIDLCKWLESQGMKLDRGSFARALLSAVPDISKPNQAQAHLTAPASSSVQEPSSANAFRDPGQPGHHKYQTMYPSHPVDRPSTVGEHLSGLRSPYPPPEHTSFRSPYFVPATAATLAAAPLAMPTPAPQVPVALMSHSRQDRQNSGSRQGSSQRENSPKPATKADAARKRNFSEIVDLTQLSDDDEPPEKKQPDPSHDIAPTWAASPDPSFYTRPPGPSNLYKLPTLIHADDKIKNMDVVQPLNRKYALRRSTYEVKTIARDVLLATGKHPEMRPLNGHLDILRESFKKVDNTSDLSTLRWDLIDPGDPPPEALESEVIDIEDEDADDEEDALKEPDRPRPPQNVPRPAPLSSASRTGLHAVPPPSPPPPTLQAPLSGPKRRGRPAKQSLSGVTGARDARALPSSNRDRGRERASSSNIGTPTTQSPMVNHKPLGYSAFRETQYASDGTPLPKKKGRPVGWRKSIHSKEAQARAAGLTPQPASASRASGLRTSQSSGGVVVIHSRSPSIGSSTRTIPSYSVYKCQWEHCAAELHNMETLRKHVFKFHNSQNAHKKWPCYWAGCGENERSIDPRTGKANGFSIMDDFKDHVEFAHLGPKSWELGDGHAGGLSESHDSVSEAYLSDSRGRMVTPLIAAPSREAIENAVEAAVPAPRKPGRPKEKSENQRAQEAQAGLEKKKRLIGPGLDRGGVRLANEKRRMGFIDDEDFEEVVSDSE